MWRRGLASAAVGAVRRRKLPETGPTFADFVRGDPSPVEENFGEETMLPRSNYLADSFGRFHNYLRISLTERCNLRCTYCMPAEGVPLSPASNLLSIGEIERLVSIFSRMGTTKIRLTGGEPTVRRDIVEICEMISKQKGIESIGMTTNGVNLLNKRKGSKYLIDELYEAGVRNVNVSLDTMCPNAFASLTRRPPSTHARVLEAIEYASSELPEDMKIKVNCVVVRGANDTHIVDFVKYFTGKRVDVRFIEWMPFNANEWDEDKLVPAAEIAEILGEQDIVPPPEPVTDPNDTTRWFRLSEQTRLGVISSMTNHFCGGCNRVRVTTDGALKTCLFGNDAVSLRDILRDSTKNDIDVARAVQKALSLKHFAHGGREDGAKGLAKHADSNRPMILIGG